MKYKHSTLLALAFAMSNSAFGAAATWVGNTDANWSTLANWSVTPVGNTPTFGAAGSSGTTLNNDLVANSTIAGITFSATAANYTTNGNAINLTNTLKTESASTQIINLDINLGASNRTVQTFTGSSVTLGGVVSGTGGINKTQGGTLFLTNASNSFSGKLSVGGTVSVSSVGAMGMNAIFNVGNSAASGNLTYTGATASTSKQLEIGPTTAAATQTGTIVNNSTTNGSLTFTNATFNVAPGAGITATRVLSLGGSSSGTNEIQGVIQDHDTGGGGLISVTSIGGIWKLSGANTYTGITTISNGGVLEANTLATGGSNSSVGASGNAATNLVFSSTSGGTLRYVGSTNASTDRGFQITNNATLESSGTGTLDWDSTSAGPALTYSTSNVTLNLGGTNTGDNKFGKVLADPATKQASLQKNGAGKWILSDSNTYSGQTIVNAGTLVVGSGGTLGGTGTTSNPGIQMAGGNLDLGGTTKTLTGSGGVSITGGTGDVIANGTVVSAADFTDTATTTLTISANLQGAGGYIKSGTGGITTLTGTNTYPGTTLVNSGSVLINGSVSGNASVASGATLGGTGAIGGTASVTGKLSPGAPGVGTLQVTGSLTWDDAPTAGANTDWVFDLATPAVDLAAADAASATACDRLAITGTGSDFNKAGSAVFRFDFGGYAGANGWFKLVEWDDTTTFIAADFSSTNLGAGKSAAFTVDATTKALYVEITGSGATGYALWQQNNGASGQTPDQDHDGDGVDNGVEYFVGGTTGFTALPGVVGNSVTWPKDSAFLGTYGTTYKLQTSTDLTGWTDVLPGDPRLISTGSSVGYNLLPAAGASLFVRLVVTP